MLGGRSVFVQIFTAAPKEVVLSLAAQRALRHERAPTPRKPADMMPHFLGMFELSAEFSVSRI